MSVKTVLLTSVFLFGLIGISLIANAQSAAQTPPDDSSVISVIDAPAPIANQTTVPPTTAPLPGAPATPTGAVDPSASSSIAAVPPTTANSNGTIVASLPVTDPSLASLTPIEKEIREQLSFQAPTVDVNRIPSLFYSVWEHDLVIDARRGLTTRDPANTDDGITEVGPRDIALAGIVWANGKDWTIWLNDMRITASAIPDEVIDLKVFKDYIELEWFDESTNQIFPIRLRAHQRFNLDSRLFLPS